ncbi:putative nuclease s1 [Phaeomoniella chlamydospora]|uniref:Putative nuclease s1 n=1 Tax=Phaeomoniella chlamydospora TaxID=158046 RepID=A0A0G2G8Q6_PHACM|nr:putative nuclease s1 [Phaeomoniella chlamydospora]
MCKLHHLVPFAPLFFPLVSAWGGVGHEAVAYVAQDFVADATKTYIQDILGTGTSYMAAVATWADTYRYTDAGGWSAPLHFVDANDSSSTSDDKLSAIKFLIHFVGDIHQPLHDEALDVGGNTISVTYDGEDTNLHHVWDTPMVESLAGGSTITTARSYATTLTSAIQDGTWSATSWTSDMTLTQSTVLKWATQANAYVCSDVIPEGVDAVEGQDLSTTYYDDHNHVVKIQLARAGYRLAAWLNLIVTGSTGGV